MATPTPTPQPRSSLPRKIILLFLLTSAAAFGTIFLKRVGYPMAYLSLISLDATLLGLTAGFGARFILKHRHTAFRLLANFAALIVGLFVLGYFTGGTFGMGPITFRRSNFDWGGLIQLVIGGISGVLSMFAWHKPVSLVAIGEEPSSRPIIRNPKPKPDNSAHATKKAGKKLRSPVKEKQVSRASIQDIPKPRRKRQREGLNASQLKRRTRKPDVQFAPGIEHRCPYCLEPVQPNDPRGIVECKICHTLHHADCWAITGVCQVPHLNT